MMTTLFVLFTIVFDAGITESVTKYNDMEMILNRVTELERNYSRLQSEILSLKSNQCNDDNSNKFDFQRIQIKIDKSQPFILQHVGQVATPCSLWKEISQKKVTLTCEQDYEDETRKFRWILSMNDIDFYLFSSTTSIIQSISNTQKWKLYSSNYKQQRFPKYIKEAMIEIKSLEKEEKGLSLHFLSKPLLIKIHSDDNQFQKGEIESLFPVPVNAKAIYAKIKPQKSYAYGFLGAEFGDINTARNYVHKGKSVQLYIDNDRELRHLIIPLTLQATLTYNIHIQKESCLDLVILGYFS
eukprot:298544_1